MSSINKLAQTANVEVLLAEGIHARPCFACASLASQFLSTITVAFGEHKGDAKDMLTWAGLGIQVGAYVNLECTGPDSVLALKAMTEALQCENRDELYSLLDAYRKR